jgi:hypothetical protein
MTSEFMAIILALTSGAGYATAGESKPQILPQPTKLLNTERPALRQRENARWAEWQTTLR